MEQNGEPKIDLRKYSQLIFDTMEQKIFSSINGAGTTGHPHTEK